MGSGRYWLAGMPLALVFRCVCKPEHHAWVRASACSPDSQLCHVEVLAYNWVLSLCFNTSVCLIHLLLTRTHFRVVVRLIHVTHWGQCLESSQAPSRWFQPLLVFMWTASSLGPWYYSFFSFLFVCLFSSSRALVYFGTESSYRIIYSHGSAIYQLPWECSEVQGIPW